MLLFIATVPALSQSKQEKEKFSSKCFGGKIEATIRHASPGQNNGEIVLDLPPGAGKVQIVWITVDKPVKGNREFKGLKAGYYSVHITDEKRCQSIIDNIQIKEIE
ncbi:hypothetical protein [Fulvivirga sedimenti]|uniref:Uncharacterized protein n=1 Tax=Fulvivirga sedimenti TaxID=2879465 RepID=A0A9X1HRN1_9BACT|nr:hypothetical protein [Fulvivirga sedimenti]MCA6074947.1 hypothetical protein [Fulvivirga sedimenti]MCA6076124.1 hypothetical protein [Fulvivirga sedimenti]MCA6077252.1 hypothetical protein [Fulvivirga sedimenti]